MGILESIRKWIDGEGAEDPLETVDESARPRRVWEEFMVKLAREVESVMEAEMFTPPGGPTYIPREYIIFLSNEDDKDWQGEKRRALEQGLFHALSKRAKELAGKNKLATKSITLELRIDGTLNRGEFRVQPVWDEAESGNTSVLARPAPANTAAAPLFMGGPNAASMTPGSSEPATLPLTMMPANLGQPALAETEAAESDSTLVRPRTTPPAYAPMPTPQITYFAVEVWLDSMRQERYLSPKNEITIGRGSRSVAVDLALKGDPEISRIHAVLSGNPAQQQYWITSKGRNSTLVNGYEIPREERTPVTPDDRIEVGRYVLRVQPV